MKKKFKWFWWLGIGVIVIFLYIMGPHGLIRIIRLSLYKNRIERKIERKKVEYELYRIKLKRLSIDKKYFEKVVEKVMGYKHKSKDSILQK